MTSDARSVPTNQPPSTNNQQLQAWQFFVLAGLGCATAATFMARGRGITAVVMLSVLMAGAALVGMAVLRALRPLVSSDDDRTAMLGQRTRAALERDKLLALRAIKELEFDRAMGKLSDEDFKEMGGRLRAKAARLMNQIDAGSGYREQIERDLSKKMNGDARLKPSRSNEASPNEREASPKEREASPKEREASPKEREASPKEREAPLKEREASAERTCESCHAANDDDARFCKNCGARM